MTTQKQIMKTETIDCEPTWSAILQSTKMSLGNNPLLSQLEVPCQVTDVLRQAQKAGKKGMIVTFLLNGQMKFENFIGDD